MFKHTDIDAINNAVAYSKKLLRRINMGWTSYNAKCYKNGKIDTIAEVIDLMEKNPEDHRLSVLAASKRGTVVYLAVRDNKTNEVFGVVVLTSINTRDYYDFSYKIIAESSGPCECGCPAKILKLLSPTENEFALNWRKRCLDNIQKNNEKRKNADSLKNLPLNSRIEMPHWNGGNKILVKRYIFGKKRPVWTDGQFRYKEIDIERQGYKVLSK